MQNASLTGDARQLIAERVHSVGALDLLLLVRDEPDRWWSAEEVSATMNCPARWAALRLDEMHAGGLLAAAGDGDRRFAFQPRTDRLADAVDALARAYAAHAGDVVRLIFAATR
jgi:hypothetical protein